MYANSLKQCWLQRWPLTLSAYTYTIKYKSGKQQGNADALSRFPLADVLTSVPTPAETIAVIGTTAGGIDCCIGVEAKDGSTLIGDKVKDVSAS